MNGSNIKCQEIKDRIELFNQTLTGLYASLESVSTTQEGNAIRAVIQYYLNELRNAYNEFKAEGCLPLPMPTSNIRILGVEITQATQFYRSLLRPCLTRPDRCTDNGIKLVANKTTAVRVYVQVTEEPDLPEIGTRLNAVLQFRQAGSNLDLIPLTPYNLPNQTFNLHDSDIQRRREEYFFTTNFRIPAFRCRGELEIKVNVFDETYSGEIGYTSETFTKNIEFTDVPPLKIRLVRIRYQNATREFDLPAHTITDFWNTAEYTLKTFPIPNINVVRDSVKLYEGDFSNDSDIFDILNELCTADGLPSDVKYYALCPGEPAYQVVVNGQSVGGVASGRFAFSKVFEQETLAHELGHTCGRKHIEGCSDPLNIDPNYPSEYSVYHLASIGEFGYDVMQQLNVIKDPANYRDFMSYCTSAKWVSPHTYEALMRHLLDSTSAANQPFETVKSPNEILYLSLRIYRDRSVVLKEWNFHLKGFRPLKIGSNSPYFTELHNKKGNIIEAQRLCIDDFYKNLDSAYLDFFIALPWRAEASMLVIKYEDQPIYSVEIGEEIPKVNFINPKTSRQLSGNQKVKWIGKCGDKQLSYILRYSNDKERSWHVIATGLTYNEFEVDFNYLPGGDNCQFQVLASEGIRTGSAMSNIFKVTMKTREAVIISPENETTFHAGESVYLFGIAQSHEDSYKPEDLNWFSNIDGYLGAGSQLIVHTLSVGKHIITMNTDDGRNGENSTNIRISIEQPD
jgi:hypothetical protein